VQPPLLATEGGRVAVQSRMAEGKTVRVVMMRAVRSARWGRLLQPVSSAPPSGGMRIVANQRQSVTQLRFAWKFGGNSCFRAILADRENQAAARIHGTGIPFLDLSLGTGEGLLIGQGARRGSLVDPVRCFFPGHGPPSLPAPSETA
jgi:hypothetical protein